VVVVLVEGQEAAEGGAAAPPPPCQQEPPAPLLVVKLVAPPRSFQALCWRHFQLYNLRCHPDKKNVARCKHCAKDVKYGDRSGSSGLKRHAEESHQAYYNATMMDEQYYDGHPEEVRQTKKAKFMASLNATPKVSKEKRRRDLLEATVAWIVEENKPLSSVEKPAFRRMMDEECQS
jgi:hypothetical protein